jgi:hypothetical protein
MQEHDNAKEAGRDRSGDATVVDSTIPQKEACYSCNAMTVEAYIEPDSPAYTGSDALDPQKI